MYEYHYKDHLGNLRVAFKEAPSAQYLATAELANQSTEQTRFANVNATRADKPQVLGQKACLTNVANTPLGWWKSLPVKKGDKVNIQTEGYYSPTGRNRNLSIDWNTFLFVNPNYGVGQGESPLYPANSLVGIGVLPILSSNPSSVPKAYLTAQFFKEGESVPYFQITRYITQAQENIWSQLPAIQQQVAENGRVEIFVANESSTPVYFDNLQIQYQGTPITQENHYYPFGMNLVGIEKEGTPNHRFQFMDREKESSFGLNWTETDWRSYDAQIGRFWQVDKLADKYWDLTPYHYVGNNPVGMTDPSGLEGEVQNFGDKVNLEGGGSSASESPHSSTGSTSAEKPSSSASSSSGQNNSNEDNPALRYAIDELGIGKNNNKGGANCECGKKGCNGGCKKQRKIVEEIHKNSYNENKSEKWFYKNKKDNFKEGTNKCNKFVFDILKKSNAFEPSRISSTNGTSPITAGEWADKTNVIPFWRILEDGEIPQTGDIAAEAHNYADATGHVAIVFSNGYTIGTNSRVGGQITITDWGFRKEQKGKITFRRLNLNTQHGFNFSHQQNKNYIQKHFIDPKK